MIKYCSIEHSSLIYLNKGKENQMGNFPLQRIIDQLVQERGIDHKDAEVFKIFENFPFNPSLDTRTIFLKNLENGKTNPSVLQEKIWEARRKVMDSDQRVQILARSIIFDRKIKASSSKTKVIMKSLYLFILQESLKVLVK